MDEGLIETYIINYDHHLDGGIPKGSIILLAGTPGTMKTSVGYSILHYNLLKNGRPGVYISLEQTEESLMHTMANLGMADSRDKGLIIADYGTFRLGQLEKRADEYWFDNLTRTNTADDVNQGLNWLKDISEFLKASVEDLGCELLVFDSLSALYSITKLENPRETLFYFFGFIRSLGVTAFLISEMAQDSKKFSVYDEDFLADGIMHMKLVDVGDSDSQLRMKCVKLRNVKHDRRDFMLMFEDGRFLVTEVIDNAC